MYLKTKITITKTNHDVIYYKSGDKNAGEREGYCLEFVARASILVSAAVISILEGVGHRQPLGKLVVLALSLHNSFLVLRKSCLVNDNQLFHFAGTELITRLTQFFPEKECFTRHWCVVILFARCDSQVIIIFLRWSGVGLLCGGLVWRDVILPLNSSAFMYQIKPFYRKWLHEPWKDHFHSELHIIINFVNVELAIRTIYIPTTAENTTYFCIICSFSILLDNLLWLEQMTLMDKKLRRRHHNKRNRMGVNDSNVGLHGRDLLWSS